jgi:hypothetical protein
MKYLFTNYTVHNHIISTHVTADKVKLELEYITHTALYMAHINKVLIQEMNG